MKLAVISFTRKGEDVCEKIINALKSAGMDGSGYTGRKTGIANPVLQTVSGSLSDWTRTQFSCCDGLIFIGAAGIAVRLIAPYLKDKFRDPAVVVVDETGKFSISLLSGHVGGANRMAEWTAKVLGAVPVVTTASDVRGRTGIDVWAEDHDFAITDRKLAKEIAAALLDGEKIGFFSDYPITPPDETGYAVSMMHRLNIWVTCCIRGVPDIQTLQQKPEPNGQTSSFLRLIPKVLVLGIGCRRDMQMEHIETAIRKIFEEYDLDIQAVFSMASIDLKKEETGLLQTAAGLGIPFITYSSEELAAVQGDFTESGFVRQVTGVGNVCERAALCSAGTGGRLIVKKQVYHGVTVAVAEKCLMDEKGGA